MRPRIGITTSTLNRAPEGPIRITAATHLTYAHSIYQAGGLPLLLPNLREVDDENEILSSLDGLLLSGGGDIDPRYWNEQPHPTLGLIDAVRDQFEMALVRAALRRAMPMLGICRGMQVMAVATGGALWQDLPEQMPDALTHVQTLPRQQASHPISIAENSLLAQIVHPGADAKAQPPLTVQVNSFHHQAPRTCGDNFTAIAWSPDGVIEALAASGDCFALGVQWHPEEMADTDSIQAGIFTAFINAVK